MRRSSLALKASVCTFALAAGCAAASIGTALPAAAAGMNSVCGDVLGALGNLAGPPGDYTTACGVGNQAFGYYPSLPTEQMNDSAMGVKNQVKDSNNSTGVGYGNRVNGVTNGAAFGASNRILGDFSTAIGDANVAYASQSTLTGLSNTIGIDGDNTIATYSSAFGNNNTITGPSGGGGTNYGSTALGSNNKVNGQQNTAIGTSNYIGYLAGASFQKSFAGGFQSSVFGNSGVAIGDGARAGDDLVPADGATAIGQGALAKAAASTGIGAFASATGNESTAIGAASTASGLSSVAVGDSSTAADKNSVAVGYQADANGARSMALGANTFTTSQNQIALGSESKAVAVHTGSYSINGGAVAGLPSDANGLLSIGTAGHERQIQNVAAGVVSASSTDAVNGSQLYVVGANVNTLGATTAAALGGGSTYAPGAGLSAPSYSIQGRSYTSVGSAFTAVDNSLNTMGSQIGSLQQNVVTLQQDVRRGYEGTAVAIASSGPTLSREAKFGVSGRWGNFRGQNAIGVMAQARVNNNLVLRSRRPASRRRRPPGPRTPNPPRSTRMACSSSSARRSWRSTCPTRAATTRSCAKSRRPASRRSTTRRGCPRCFATSGNEISTSRAFWSTSLS